MFLFFFRKRLNACETFVSGGRLYQLSSVSDITHVLIHSSEGQLCCFNPGVSTLVPSDYIHDVVGKVNTCTKCKYMLP